MQSRLIRTHNFTLTSGCGPSFGAFLGPGRLRGVRGGGVASREVQVWGEV